MPLYWSPYISVREDAVCRNYEDESWNCVGQTLILMIIECRNVAWKLNKFN